MSRFTSFLLGRRVGNSPPPRFLAFRSSKLFILVTICTAVFTDIFLYGVIVPVIPFAISARANVAPDDVQYWVSVLLAVYGAALLVTAPFVGWYADRSSSRREPLLIGLVALAGATVMLCLARNIGVLVAGRVLQGVSASIVWTTGQALLVDTVGQKDIGQTMGYVSISMSVGILIAPLLGGVVYESAGYYAVYYMSFALIGFDIVLRLSLVEKKIAAQWAEPDLEEATDSSTVVEDTIEPEISEKMTETSLGGDDIHSNRELSDTTMVFKNRSMDAPANSTPAAPPTSEQVVTKSPWRRMPPVITLLASRRLLAALWGCLVQASLMTAFDTVVPLFVQRVFGWNSTGAGLVFLAIFIPGFAAPAVGWAADKYGPRWLAVFGFVLAVPFWVLLRLVDHNSLSQKVLLCALLALLGVALTIAMTPLMAEITYVVEAKERRNPGSFGPTGAYAQAYGLFVCAFAAGTMIGPLWSGLVETKAGWGTMSWTLGLFSASGAIPALIWTGGLITKDNAKSGEERAIGRPLQEDVAAEREGAAAV